MTKASMYRSGLEKKFAEAAPRGAFKYEPYKVPYVVYRDYIPDFVHTDASGMSYLIECKGYFRQGDTQKYKAIRDSIENSELVFLLSDEYKKVRKGSKMTMGQWCAKENIPHFTMKTLDKLFEYVGIK